MSMSFLIGAVLGSGAAIAFCSRPAERLLVRVQSRIERARRR